MSRPQAFLCIARDFKGVSCLTTLKARGHRVYLLTDEKNKQDPWPWDAIDNTFYVPARGKQPHNKQVLVEGMAWLMRTHGIDRIMALDDFDVEDAALLREEFRIPGMGQTTARHFRDKLAMRMRAAANGVRVPQFAHLFDEGSLARLFDGYGGAALIKPRSEASAAGIKKVYSYEEAIVAYASLGEHNYEYLAERFAPGAVYHVDAIVHDGEVKFARVSRYVAPPLSIVQGGGLFQTRTLELDNQEHKRLVSLTGDVMQAFGLLFGTSHTEFIGDGEGNYLFLETSSRVGGAYISNMVQHASGVDLWAEWAKLESAELTGEPYEVPVGTGNAGAIVLRAVSQEHPDLSGFDHPRIVERIVKRYHAGFILAGESAQEVGDAQDWLARRLAAEF